MTMKQAITLAQVELEHLIFEWAIEDLHEDSHLEIYSEIVAR